MCSVLLTAPRAPGAVWWRSACRPLRSTTHRASLLVVALVTKPRNGVDEGLVFGRVRAGGGQRRLAMSLGGKPRSADIRHPYLHRSQSLATETGAVVCYPLTNGRGLLVGHTLQVTCNSDESPPAVRSLCARSGNAQRERRRSGGVFWWGCPYTRPGEDSPKGAPTGTGSDAAMPRRGGHRLLALRNRWRWSLTRLESTQNDRSRVGATPPPDARDERRTTALARFRSWRSTWGVPRPRAMGSAGQP